MVSQPKNDIEDLRSILFDQLRRLNKDNLTPVELKKEMDRSRSITEVGRVIVESAKAETTYLKQRDGKLKGNKFLDGNGPNLPEPPQ